MSFTGFIVKAGSAVRDGATLRYTIHIPWYRSLPLSSVIDIKVVADGTSVSRDLIRLAVNGGEYLLDELADRWDDLWFVQDEAQVVVCEATLASASETEITTTVMLRSPYIMIGPNTPLVTSCTATHRFALDPIGATR